jgi:T5SS/PEP-CTERM-associated repeat protein
MSPKFRLSILTAVFAALGAPMQAQDLEVTGPLTISNSETYQSVFIGATNAATPAGSLTVTDGAVVSGDAQLVLGSFADNTGNSLTVDGAGSAINFASVDQSRFLIGSQGGSSSVLITNGGSIVIENTTNGGIFNTAIMNVGASAGAGGNSVVVSGAGSTLAVVHGETVFLGSSTPIRIGGASAGNEFVVKDGAVFNASPYQVQIGSTGTASNNTVLYTGAGTVVTNWYTTVGLASGGNSLTVADGAVLWHLGANPSFDVSTTNGVTNTVLVTGPGSTLKGSVVRLGDLGVAQVVISNGAVMTNASQTTLGSRAGSSGSTLLVTGFGSLLTAGSSSIVLGSTGSDTVTTVTDGGRIANNFGTLGGGTGTNHRAIVDGGTWSNTSNLRIGFGAGGGHTLVVTNGGVVSVGNQGLQVGHSNTATGNSVLVTGTGSLLTTATLTDTSIGLRSSSNSLTVENGALFNVTSSGGFRLGQESTANANSLLVTGAGTVFTNSTTLVVGRDGSSNTVVLADGAFMRNASMVVSSNATALGNSVLVTGAGTVLSNTNLLQVGLLGTGQMQVTDGAVVHAGNTLGIGAGSSVTTDSGVWIGQGRPAAQSINVLHTNANSNSIATVNGLLQASGSVTVGGRGIVLGSGTIEAPTVTFASNSTLAPGNSPGNLTIDGNLVWQGGANYNWEVYDATGGAGAGWDLVTVSGALDLSALTVNSQFNINLWSLSDLPQTSGEAINFDNTQDYMWTILTASDGITGFSADKFNINTAAINGTGGFTNALAPLGTFSMLQSGNDLKLTYVVPEPSTYALLALAAGGLGAHVWRRRRK